LTDRPFAWVITPQFGRSGGEQRRTTASCVQSCGSLVFGCEQELFVDKKKRAEREDFKLLLGYRSEEETAAKHYPTLAPVLYIDGDKRTDKLFKSVHINRVFFFNRLTVSFTLICYLMQIFRRYLFGPSSISEAPNNHKGGQKELHEVLKVKTITAGAIAAAAILYC
jgi:hypothetical protein